MEPQKIVIIGAGPAGLLLAHYLLQRGHYRIHLYERRPNPAAIANFERTFPISLQERGRKALRAIDGLEAAIAAQSVFCKGTTIHHRQRKARRFPRKQAILTIDRNRLVSILYERLLATYSPEQVQVTFECECVAIDAAAKTVTVQPAIGAPLTVPYDRLIGADGARSRVREYLVQTTDLQCTQTPIPDAYKSVFLSRIHPQTGEALAADQIHAFNKDNQTRMLMVPQPNDQLQGVIIFNAEANPLAALHTSTEVLTWFQTHFPIFGQRMEPAEAEALLQRPVGQVVTVRCDRLHEGDSILLLGDAVHAVSPSIGQGCNASLQDVAVFAAILDRCKDDWSQALPIFSQAQIPESHALQDLSNYVFPRTKRLVAEFFLRVMIGRKLNQWFPKRFPPFVFDLILDSDMPYSEVLRLNQHWVDRVKRSQPATP